MTDRREPNGNVVMDFTIGNTHVQICDNYCRDKTPEQVQEILDDLGRIASRGYFEQLDATGVVPF